MKKIKCLTVFELKLIAIITMTIDHIGAVLLPQYGFLRTIGRIAFPIYCFLLVEGYYHTKDVRKYFFRLFIFALISEPFFDITFNKRIIYTSHQNVFFTLLIGLVTIMVCDFIYMFYNKNHKILMYILMFVAMISGGMCADILSTDYSKAGIYMIVAFYVFREKNFAQIVSQSYINAILIGKTQMYAIFALPLIFAYNGKIGKYKWKWFFYAYYPLHLFVLYTLIIIF